MDLGGCFDKVLEVGAEEEVSKGGEFAVVLVLDCEWLLEESETVQ